MVQRVSGARLPRWRSHPLTYVISAGALIGTLDIVFAWTFWGIKAGLPATRVLQSVAAGLLGPAAYEGGAQTAMLGGVLHYLIAITMAGAWYLVARRWPVLNDRPVAFGGMYGLVLYGVMNYVVIPLSAAGPRATDPAWMLSGVAVHVLLIGMPIAMFVRLAILENPRPSDAGVSAGI